MKVGDYCRTKDGEIGEIRVIIEDKVFMNTNQYYSTNIIKSSPNIIDLIEVGDYVNGCPVLHKEENEVVCGLLLRYKEKDIKSIVTHEQFSQMEYKVGE